MLPYWQQANLQAAKMLVFAHRGASGYAPENTLAAIEMAMLFPIHGIEIDIHWADNELWVIHDSRLERTTNGQGRISERTVDQLKALDAGQGQRLPTLREVLQTVHGRCALNLELKSVRGAIQVLNLLDEAVDKLGFTPQQFLLSSFNHHLINEIHSINRRYLTGALTASCPIDYASFAQALDCHSIHIDIDFVSAEFVRDAHARGLQVYLYTVDGETDIRYAWQLGVDGIFSNYPDRALTTIAALQGAAMPAKV